VSTLCRWRFSRRLSHLAWGALLCVLACPTPQAFARTVLSDQINAEANFLVAFGEMTRSVAEARKINAEAVAIEIQNSVEYVKAFYERRHIHDAEWRVKNPTEWEREEKLQKLMKKRVNEQYQYIMNHGSKSMTDVLNWLLGELSNSTTSLQYVFDAKSPLQLQADLELTEGELQQIQLTDGGRDGKRLVFPANGGAAALPRWPPALRVHPCDAARDNYDRARDAAVKDLRAKREISPENQDRLLQAVDALFAALDEAYPSEVRKKHREYAEYWTAKRFVNTLLAATNRAIAVNDPSAFSGDLRFQGKSLLLLLQHMHRNGLQFAEPGPGADRLYRILFEDLRAMYAELVKEQPANGQQGNGAAKD
jgi:hypothetical protein